MDFSTDETLRELARQLGRKEIAPSTAQRDHDARWDGSLALRMGDAGLLGACLPRMYGGHGRTASELLSLLIGFGEGAEDAGLARCWSAHLGGCAVPIWKLGTEAQRLHYLPPLAWGGLLGTLAHAEPPTVAAPTGVETSAAATGHGWRLDGQKSWVIGGAVADLFLVTAATPQGVSAFLVRRGTPGLHVERDTGLSGLRSAQLAHLSLRGCEVPTSALLGPAGAALSTVIPLAQRWEQLGTWAPWIGLLNALIEQTAAAARERMEFGRPAAQSQLLRAALADMKIRAELGLRLQARAAWHLDRDAPDAAQHITSARLFLSTSAASATQHALRLQGPRARTLAERLHRDAATLAQLSSDDVSRSILAGSLLGLG